MCISQTMPDYETYKKKYPGEKAIIFNDQEEVLIDADKNSYKITENIVKETYLLQNTGASYSSDQVYNSHFYKTKNIEAKTLVPDGKKFSVKKVDKFVENKSQSSYVFYDEVVATSFVFPAVQPGAITSLKYTRELDNPLLSGSFFFKWHIPCEISRLTIKTDKRAGLKFKLFNVEPNSIEFTQEERGKYIIYSWTAKNIKAGDNATHAPDIRYYFPHIVFFIENLNPADTANKDLKGLNGLYHYYYSLIKDINKTDDPKVSEEVKKITAGINSEEEKVKRIFYWVQENITYVAIEEGMQGLIPDEAAQVFNKRYGDCKGMSSLLQYMLRLAGIKAHLTWIGTRHIPYKYTDIPSMAVDNHMIVTYYSNEQPVFLDCTNNYIPYGIPSDMIQGKQALLSIDEKTFKIEEVPVIKSDCNLFNDSTFFTIHDNIVEGTGNLSFTGYTKANYTYSIADKDKIKTREQVLSIVSRGNNKFFLDTFQIKNIKERDLPLGINYKFRINDYFREIDGEVYLNMNLKKFFDNVIYDPEKRFVPVENSNATLFKCVSVFEIPEGYQVALLPKDKSASFEKLSFSIHYKMDGKKVIQEKEIRNDFMILNTSEFKQWNEVIESLNQAYRDVLILKKNNK
jgi:hypothetical protein